MFEDQAAALRASFGSSINVTGGCYPLPSWRSNLASTVTALSWVAVLFSFAGKMIIDATGIVEPAWLKSAREGKFVFLLIYLGLSYLGGQLSSTGAFEVTIDGTTPLWSKLEKGGAPPLSFLFENLELAGLRPLSQMN